MREREEKKEKKKTVFSKESNAENWSNIKDNGKTICNDNGHNLYIQFYIQLHIKL